MHQVVKMGYNKKMNEIENKISEVIEKLHSKDDFSKFLDLLHQDYKINKSLWENADLEDFLEALSVYSRDVEGYYNNLKINIDPKQPSWRLFADILLGARVYE